MDTGATAYAEAALEDFGLPASFAARECATLGEAMEWAALQALDDGLREYDGLALWPQPCTCAGSTWCDYHGECACAEVVTWHGGTRPGDAFDCDRHPRPLVADAYYWQLRELKPVTLRHQLGEERTWD